MASLPSRPRLLARVVLGVCFAFLAVQEVRVVIFGGGSLGPLSSRGAHDVVLLAAALLAATWARTAARKLMNKGNNGRPSLSSLRSR